VPGRHLRHVGRAGDLEGREDRVRRALPPALGVTRRQQDNSPKICDQSVDPLSMASCQSGTCWRWEKTSSMW
jgi:hypothetical protein